MTVTQRKRYIHTQEDDRRRVVAKQHTHARTGTHRPTNALARRKPINR